MLVFFKVNKSKSENCVKMVTQELSTQSEDRLITILALVDN